jgi:hypothetical protein
MTRTLLRRGIVLAALFALALAAVALTACGSDTSAATKNAAAISAINMIDKAGLHDLDTAINKDGTVPATARTTALHLQTVALLTEWPSKQMKDDAKKLADALGALADATNSATPDLKKAGAAATDVHEKAHDFSKEVWDYLDGKAGIKADGATEEKD